MGRIHDEEHTGCRDILTERKSYDEPNAIRPSETPVIKRKESKEISQNLVFLFGCMLDGEGGEIEYTQQLHDKVRASCWRDWVE